MKTNSIDIQSSTIKTEDMQYFGLKLSTIKLVFLALFVSIILSSSDVIYSGTRYIYTPDMYNHFILSASAAESLRNGQIPPRTSDTLLGGLGLPHHQFYSPFCHFVVACLGLLFSDIMLGYTITSIIFMVIAFVYCYKLIKYFTLSNICALVGAFIFITGPYLSTDRVLRGAFAEYIGFSLMPLVLYMNLRAINSKKIKYWIFAVISSSILALSHLITFIFFYLIFGLFLSIYLIQIIVIKKYRNKKLLKNFIKKIIVLLTIGIATFLIDMYYFYPILFYNDLNMKQEIFSVKSISYFSYLVSTLSLLSIFDMPFIGLKAISSPRFQIGLLLFASYLIYVYLLFNETKSKLYWPLVITSSVVLFTIINPIIFSIPIQNLKVIQFSYRLIADFQLLATIMGSLALLHFFKKQPIFNKLFQKMFAIIIIVFSLILVIPYLYPNQMYRDYPKQLSDDNLYHNAKLTYNSGEYLRYYSQDDEQKLILRDIPVLDGVGNSGKKVFSIDLKSYFENYNEDGVYLNILYYPGLQDIDITIDGLQYEGKLETYFQSRPDFISTENPDTKFHGLKIKDLPRNGNLLVKTKFTGSHLGNFISVLSMISLLIYSVFKLVKNRLNLKKIKMPKL
jgi:hypothetical protein